MSITLKRLLGKFNERGKEVMSTERKEVPFKVGRSSDDRIRDFIRQELSARAAQHGYETWEEADDFDVPDPEDIPDFSSQYELTQMQEEIPFVRPEVKKKPEPESSSEVTSDQKDQAKETT